MIIAGIKIIIIIKITAGVRTREVIRTGHITLYTCKSKRGYFLFVKRFIPTNYTLIPRGFLY